MFNVGDEVEIYNADARDLYSRDMVLRLTAYLGCKTVITRVDDRDGRIRYNLEIDFHAMWWHEHSLRLIETEYVSTPEDDLLPVNTYVKHINRNDLFRIISIRPKSMVKNIDYELIRTDGRGYGNIKVRHNDIIVPSNKDLYEEFGIENKPMSTLPNPFKGYKYPIGYVNYRSMSKHSIITGITPSGQPVFTNEVADILKQMVVLLDNNIEHDAYKDRTLVYYKDDKLTFRNLECKIEHPKNRENWLEEAIIDLCKIRVKSITESSILFGNRNKKKKMLEESNSGTLFNVKSVISNYLSKKTNEVVNIIEVFNGEINLKFKVEDLEFVLPDLRGYNKPKDRTITKGTLCKIVNDKHIKLDKGAEVQVLEINNVTLGKVIRGSYDKNKYAKSSIVKVLTEDNKTVTCRIKNLRKI